MSNQEVNKEQEKKLKVLVIKLKSGDEIITAVEGVIPLGEDQDNPDDYLYVCLDPAFPAMDPRDPTRLALMPWNMFSMNRQFHIPRSEMIVKPETCVEDIEEQYRIYFAKSVEDEVKAKANGGESKSKIIVPPSAKKSNKVVSIVTD